jgi:hypothetical protein
VRMMARPLDEVRHRELPHAGADLLEGAIAFGGGDVGIHIVRSPGGIRKRRRKDRCHGDGRVPEMIVEKADVGLERSAAELIELRRIELPLAGLDPLEREHELDVDPGRI